MEIYNKIKELANQENITIKDLEIKLEFANGTIGKWKKHMPKADKLYKVAKYFKIKMEYFFE